MEMKKRPISLYAIVQCYEIITLGCKNLDRRYHKFFWIKCIAEMCRNADIVSLISKKIMTVSIMLSHIEQTD